MKITALHFGLPNNKKLDEAFLVVTNTFEELGDTKIETIRIAFLNIPYFDGMTSTAVDQVIGHISTSQGVIVAVPAVINMPNALCATFFEYMSLDVYKNAFANKNCMTLTVSDNGGERAVIDTLSYMLGTFGAHDAVRISVGANADDMGQDSPLKELIERQTEDYYRIIRQNRKYVIPSYGNPTTSETSEYQQEVRRELTDSEYERLLGKERKRLTSAELLKQRLAQGAFKEKSDKENSEKSEKSENEKTTQKDGGMFGEIFGEIEDNPIKSLNPSNPLTSDNNNDIDEIVKFFAGKLHEYKSDEDTSQSSDAFEGFTKQVAPKPVARVKNVKQMTLSLPHYFQPQLSAGLNAVIQISVSGVETFDCYLTISNVVCNIAEGIIEQKDITLVVDSKIWADILKGKYTAQKAFMVGQLKVRGNFMLLTKFDQLFTLNMV